MTGRVLDGRPVAADLIDQIAARVQCLKSGIQPQAVYVSVGDSKPGLLYFRRLERLGRRAGVTVAHRQLPADVPTKALCGQLYLLSQDEAIDGILVEMPLPDHLALSDLSSSIDPRKDVDGITIQNAGRLYLGLPVHPPSTASAILHLLLSTSSQIRGRRAVVVGRSNVVGRPVAQLLVQHDATVTTAHSKTLDLGTVTREAEILVAAAGKPRLITADMLRPGVVVVDAGINVTETGVVGDVDFEACREVASAITPVPGGVGPVTNAVLLRHVVDSAEERAGP